MDGGDVTSCWAMQTSGQEAEQIALELLGTSSCLCLQRIPFLIRLCCGLGFLCFLMEVLLPESHLFLCVV